MRQRPVGRSARSRPRRLSSRLCTGSRRAQHWIRRSNVPGRRAFASMYRNREREGRAHAKLTLDPNPPTVELDKLRRLSKAPNREGPSRQRWCSGLGNRPVLGQWLPAARTISSHHDDNRERKPARRRQPQHDIDRQGASAPDRGRRGRSVNAESFAFFTESPTVGCRLSSWCARGDLNSHGLPHWILSPARLPVSPLARPRSPPILHRS